MKKTFRLIGIVIMAIICCGLTACGGDDDDSNNGAISEYVGSWSCTSPATYQTSTIVTKGTTLLITSSGDMTWTMPDGNRYNAKMRALGDDWADITYKGKTYRAEIYVSNNKLWINVNGNRELTVKDFPFDGGYSRLNEGNNNDDDAVVVSISYYGDWTCTSSTNPGNRMEGLLVGDKLNLSASGTYTSTAPILGSNGTYMLNGVVLTFNTSSENKPKMKIEYLSENKLTLIHEISSDKSYTYEFVR